MITPVAFSSIGSRSYVIFAVFNAVAIPIVYLCYPETAYRSLEELDVIFAKSTSIFDAVRVARTEPKHFGSHGEVVREVLQDVYETKGIGDTKQQYLSQHAEVVTTEHVSDAIAT